METLTSTKRPAAQRQARWVRALARVSALVALSALWFVVLSPTALGGPVGTVWVSGTSMEPGLVSGDLVVTYQRDTYEVGDIVAFEIPQGGTVIHRIVKVTDEGLYRFQGDNRKHDDPWDLPAESIVGSSVVEVHKAALVLSWLGRPIALAAMVTLIALLHLAPGLAPRDEHVDDLSET